MMETQKNIAFLIEQSALNPESKQQLLTLLPKLYAQICAEPISEQLKNDILLLLPLFSKDEITKLQTILFADNTISSPEDFGDLLRNAGKFVRETEETFSSEEDSSSLKDLSQLIDNA